MFFKPQILIAVFLSWTLVAQANTKSAGNEPPLVIEMVTVGNPGNANDIPINGTGYGGVPYTYKIGKYEVTNDQYVLFLNAVAATDPNGLYNLSMVGSNARCGITRSGSSGSYTYAVKANMGNKPVNVVTWYDAVRFCNWLHNGQPTGAQDATTTEDGAYTIIAEVYPDTVITRKAGAKYFIPTENEWYKAAYYSLDDGDGSPGYWLYPTQSDAAPTIATANATGDISNPGVNVANFNRGADWNGLDGNVTTVGSAGAASASYYGTYDMGGNVCEWNEGFGPTATRSVPGRCVRGGSWSLNKRDMQSSNWFLLHPPWGMTNSSGFRVASPF